MSETPHPEIVIIRRHSGEDHDSHHSGVWKIAFADFMTAMMAFFLVMWLINAANEKTKQAVASYFNPIKLANLNTKGLSDPKVVDSGPAKKDKDPPKAEREQVTEGTHPPNPEAKPNYTEDALFRDPYSVLAAIAKSVPASGEGAAAGAAKGAEAQRPIMRAAAMPDPFDPAFRASSAPAAAPSAGPLSDAAAPMLQTSNRSATGPSPDTKAGAGAAGGTEARAASPPRDAAEAPHASPSRPGAVPQPSQGGQGAQLQKELSETLQPIAQSGQAPKIEVRQTAEGVLIDLTDDAQFGMFAVGSAQPDPKLIAIMAKIAGVLKTRSGQVVIRGHTDSRPFHSQTYDNWRLSSDRATMAYYMLVRGGLDERRVARIEGYADRRPRVPADPEAAENRRIEILVEAEQR